MRLSLLALLLACTASAQPSADVPVKRVILFTSGVGYFEHEGAIRGDADLTLRFEQRALDDVIKSLVVEDPRGRVSEVVYPSQAPLQRRLQAFAVDFSGVSGVQSLFAQMRGAVLEIETSSGTFRGPLTSVDGPAGGENDPGTRLTILTAGGLRTIPLANARRVEIVDDALRAEVEGALAALAEGSSGERKPVTVRFRGGRSRDVKLGYVVESPVWKTTYRLVLPPADEREGYLQGWAVVENPTESDWDDVRLELVSGRPISFEMDLYSPRYLQRPRVALPDEAAGVVPRTYAAGTGGAGHLSSRAGGRSGVMQGQVRDSETGEPLPGANVVVLGTNQGAATDRNGRFTITGLVEGRFTVQISYVGYETLQREVTLEPGSGLLIDADLQSDMTGIGEVVVQGDGRINARGGRGRENTYYIDGVQVVTGEDVSNLPLRGVAAAAPPPPARPLDPGAGVQSSATASALGELFAYVLGDVSIPRRGSAMLPIVTDPVNVERLSVFTPGASGRHPLRGARLRNTTEKHLRGGPITVFDDGYAGDALLPDLPPGDDRLVTFAVDQDLLIDPVDEAIRTGEVQVATVTNGVLTLRREQVRQTDYRVENRGERNRVILIEHPRLSGGALTGGLEADETAPGLYRLRLAVGAGAVDTLSVREAAPTAQTYQLTSLSPQQIIALVRSTAGLSSEVRRALDRATDLAREAAQAQARVNELERERAEIDREQRRIRENLQSVDSSSDYARRLLRKLNDQEDRLESLDGDLDRARAEFQRRRNALERGVRDLDAR